MKNPYEEYSDKELGEIINDINISRKEGKRVESFVPYAKQIKETIGGDFTLREALIFAEKDFEKEINKRFLNMISTKGDD